MPIDVNSINLNPARNEWFRPFELECVRKPDKLMSSRNVTCVLEIHPLLVMARSIELAAEHKMHSSDLSSVYSDMFMLMLDYLENGFVINNFKLPFNA